MAKEGTGKVLKCHKDTATRKNIEASVTALPLVPLCVSVSSWLNLVAIAPKGVKEVAPVRRTSGDREAGEYVLLQFPPQ